MSKPNLAGPTLYPWGNLLSVFCGLHPRLLVESAFLTDRTTPCYSDGNGDFRGIFDFDNYKHAKEDVWRDWTKLDDWSDAFLAVEKAE